jgi:oligopeptide transport system substrate-binding protein
VLFRSLGWIGSSPSPESEFMKLWRCSSRNNRAKWCNQDYERLLDDAARTVDPVARLAKVKEAEAVMLAEAPIIPLYTYTQKNLARPYLRGLAQNPIAQPPLWKAWRDPDWRSKK